MKYPDDRASLANFFVFNYYFYLINHLFYFYLFNHMFFFFLFNQPLVLFIFNQPLVLFLFNHMLIISLIKYTIDFFFSKVRSGFRSRFFYDMSSALVTNNNRNVKNGMLNDYLKIYFCRG